MSDSKLTQPQVNTLLDVMAQELQRSMAGLRVPGSPRPYHMLYALRRRQGLSLGAAHGSLLRDESNCRSSIYADLRVGNHRFDNVVDAGLNEEARDRESADWLEAPSDLDPMALRLAYWKLSQVKFDEALEDYYDHRKAMVSEYLRDEADSFTRERAVVHVEDPSELPFPKRAWESAMLRVSRRFLDHPEIYDPAVSLRAERIDRWLVTTEGTRVFTQDLYVDFSIGGWVLTDDGVYVEASRNCYLRTLESVPDGAEMERLLDEVLSDLESLRHSESPGAFIGPALLAGQAASTMFHEALGHRLEGGRLVARGETRTFAHKRGQLILPPYLDVYDDPTRTDGDDIPMWGSYRVDDEGVRAGKVTLIQRGILVDFLRNRTPIPASKEQKSSAIAQSSGHGRHDGVEPTMARMGNLVVDCAPEHRETWAALELRLVELARAQGRKQAAIILKIRSGETTTNSYDFQVFKGELAEIYILDVETGERRRVRDLELIGTPLSALQRIAGCGGEDGIDRGYCYAESGSLPVGGCSPAILLSEVELQQRSTTSFHEPLLPPPFADDGSRGRTGRLRERGRRRR